MTIKDLNEKYLALKKVYDEGVEDFQRRLALKDAFNELRQKLKDADEELQRLEEKYKNGKGQIPPAAQYEYQKEVKELWNAEIKLKERLTFSEEEFNRASDKSLKGSELALIIDEFKGPPLKKK
jgi:predicted  nucleic acid-binding Zn-ribbon protein